MIKHVSLCCAALMLACAPLQAVAQSQAQRDAALGQLAEILGALAHLETLCEDSARSRGDMESVLASEELTTTRRSVLIDAYNRGFRGVASTHQRCTSGSERLIALHHERGAQIIFELIE